MRNLLRAVAVVGVALATAATGVGSIGAATSDGDGPEPMRLECRQLGTEPGAPAAVGCAWSRFEGDGLRAYQLWRASAATGRVVVFESRDVDDTHAVDRPLRPGRYAYRIHALGRTGRVIGTARVEVVVVEAPSSTDGVTRPDDQAVDVPTRLEPAEQGGSDAAPDDTSSAEPNIEPNIEAATGPPADAGAAPDTASTTVAPPAARGRAH